MAPVLPARAVVREAQPGRRLEGRGAKGRRRRGRAHAAGRARRAVAVSACNIVHQHEPEAAFLLRCLASHSYPSTPDCRWAQSINLPYRFDNSEVEMKVSLTSATGKMCKNEWHRLHPLQVSKGGASQHGDV